jgi:hypothetical protein
MPYRQRGLNPKARRIDLCLHLGWQFRPAALGPLRDHGCRSMRVRCLPNFQAGSEAKLGHKWMLTRASASDDSPFRPNCHLNGKQQRSQQEVGGLGSTESGGRKLRRGRQLGVKGLSSRPRSLATDIQPSAWPSVCWPRLGSALSNVTAAIILDQVAA